LWRFVVVQQLVGKLAPSAIEFPPMQAPESFNLDIKERDRRKDQTASRAITSCTLALGGAFQAAHAHKTRVSLQISAVHKQFVWAVGRENWERGQTVSGLKSGCLHLFVWARLLFGDPSLSEWFPA